MDVVKAAEDLERVEDSGMPLLQGLKTVAPYLLSLPPYRGTDGAKLLVKHIRQAIRALPEEEREPARRILFPKNPKASKTERRKKASDSNNGDLIHWRSRWLLLRIANHLRILIADDLMRSTMVYHYLEYRMRFELDPDDPRKHIVHRDLHVEFNVPDQQIIAIRHQYHPGEPLPEVEALAPDDTKWLARIPIQFGNESGWWAHIFWLDRKYDPGEAFSLRTREVYFDKDRAATKQYDLFLGLRVMSAKTRVVELEFLLPPTVAKTAQYQVAVLAAGGASPAPRPLSPDEQGRARYIAPPTDLIEGNNIRLKYLTTDLYGQVVVP